MISTLLQELYSRHKPCRLLNVFLYLLDMHGFDSVTELISCFVASIYHITI